MEGLHFNYRILIDGLPLFFRNRIPGFTNRKAFLVPDHKSVDPQGKRLADLGKGLKLAFLS